MLPRAARLSRVGRSLSLGPLSVPGVGTVIWPWQRSQANFILYWLRLALSHSQHRCKLQIE